MELLDSSEAVAFDVFDTLVTRPFMKPEHLFHYMERKYGSPGFAKKRISAERRARRSIRREIDLDEIYTLLESCNDLKEKELSEELALCVPDPDAKEFWDRAVSSGKPVVVISDMYLPAEHISRMLEKCGFTGYSRLYVSNDHSVGKCDGGLYDIVLSDLKIEPSSLLMVGDNRNSDISVPESKGIRTFRWKPLKERYGDLHPVEVRRASKEPQLSMVAGLDMVFDRKDGDYWYSVGRRFAGPLVTAFGTFILDHDGECDRLVFCSRDGYMAMKAYQALGGKKEVSYLYTSRFLTKVLSGTCLEGEKCMKLASEYLVHTHWDELDFDPRNPDRLKENSERINGILEKDAEEYERYVRDTVGDSDRIMIVDSTTLRFTAQKEIESRLGRKVSGCYYTVSKKSDTDHTAFAERSNEHLTWSHVNLSEYFLSSDEPPVRGYLNGQVITMEPVPREAERISHCKELQKGMMDYISDFRSFFGDYLPSFDHRTIDGWLDVLIRNEKIEEGPLWNTEWPSDTSNTEYADLIFRPRDIINWAKCTAGSVLKR